MTALWVGVAVFLGGFITGICAIVGLATYQEIKQVREKEKIIKATRH